VKPHRLRICCSSLLLLAVLAPAGASIGELRVLEPPAGTSLPEALLPHQLSDPGVDASVWMLAAAGFLTRGGAWTHRLCLGDERAAARILAGLDDAAESGQLENPEVDSSYRQLLAGCPDGSPEPDHAIWLLRAARDASQPSARDLLFGLLASVHPLDEPEVFEQEAPDDALVTFHSRRSDDTTDVYSVRLAALVERRLAEGDARGLRTAAYALARSTDARAVETLRRLLAREPPAELAEALWRALDASPRADGFALFQAYCVPWLAEARQRRSDRATSSRGSRRGWGEPCARARMLFPRSPADSALSASPRAPSPCDESPRDLAVFREPVIGTCFHLGKVRGTQFAGDVELLRAIARRVRPYLDEARFHERWPAADAVRRERGEIEHTTFVHGDGVIVRVPPDAFGDPDAAVAATIARELERALPGERWIDVEHEGVLRRFAFDPCGKWWCAEAMLEIANMLLDEIRAPVRLARDPAEPYVLRIRVEAAAGR